jgi:transcription initiation factor TFIIE subunit alpha
MQVDLLKELVVDIVGEGNEKIVDLLHGKKNVNEFIIAKKLDVTINQTRNVLYKLADFGLVRFIRKKDTKKGGWYTYFWTLETGKALDLFKNKVERELEKKEAELSSRGKNRYYYSPEIDREFSEEEALENDFICPETGEVLELKDNSELVVNLEKEISGLRDALKKITESLTEVRDKEDKARVRRVRAMAKKKAEEREKKRKERARKMKKKVKKKKKAVKKKVKKKKKKVKKKKKAVKKKAVKKVKKKKSSKKR